jgi:ornithine cyclodeaminase/alanine dehydrogenase-like protein (mu-crystallin family)
MQFIDGREVHRLCEWQALIEALREAHRQPMPLVDRSELHHAQDGIRQTYFNLPAWQPGAAMGTKIVTVIPQNPASPAKLPAVQAAYVLCDGKAGSPVAVMDGTALTYRKTAADSALASKLLSRPDAQTLLVVGAGGLAPYLLSAHRAVRPSIAKILVWNRNAGKARALAASSAAEAVSDLARAVPEADIITCATASNEPLVRGEWLKPGAHLDLVGSFTPDMRECDDEAVRISRIFVDSRQFAIDQPGDLASPLRRGVISRDAIEADLFDLCRKGLDRPRANNEVTLFKNGGGAHLDLFTALFIWNAVKRIRLLAE